jgi:hypothetical protein
MTAEGINEEIGKPRAQESAIAKDQVILDDLIVDGSLCVGFDCINGESFGFDTIRLKENNTRIKFQDTSTSASFPSNDWQITANDSENGGANKFSIDDIDGGRTPFTIEASAPSHSLYVDDGGRVGLGTSTPVAQLHVKDGNTPTLRLEQDGSSGFTPQTWDVAGNEANFFIRDATNGSELPFRIVPGAPSNSLYINSAGKVGLGLTNPVANLDIKDSTSATAQRTLLQLTNNGDVNINLTNSVGTQGWVFQNYDNNNQFRITRVGTGVGELELDSSGNLVIQGTLTVRQGETDEHTYPDYVFEPGYELMPLDELKSFVSENRHLPNIPSANSLVSEGLNMTHMQIRLIEKVEELTLYTITQEEKIKMLEQRLAELEELLNQ